MDFFRHVLPIDGEDQPRPTDSDIFFSFSCRLFPISQSVRQFELNGSRAQLLVIAWSLVTQHSMMLRGLDFLGHPHPFC